MQERHGQYPVEIIMSRIECVLGANSLMAPEVVEQSGDEKAIRSIVVVMKNERSHPCQNSLLTRLPTY